MSDYQPISCSVYDQLESLAVQKVYVTLVYQNETGEFLSLYTQIRDLQTRDRVEYLITTEGLAIRLDHLQTINQLPVSEACIR